MKYRFLLHSISHRFVAVGITKISLEPEKTAHALRQRSEASLTVV